jgi:hypothetical protein
MVGLQTPFLNFKIEKTSSSVISCVIVASIFIVLFLAGLFYVQYQARQSISREGLVLRPARPADPRDQTGLELNKYQRLQE